MFVAIPPIQKAAATKGSQFIADNKMSSYVFVIFSLFSYLSLREGSRNMDQVAFMAAFQANGHEEFPHGLLVDGGFF